jgi:BMFP domain-containing protein YqiC
VLLALKSWIEKPGTRTIKMGGGMGEDIFESIADLEKRSDEVIERARLRAVELRADVERRLKALGDELERDYGLPRGEIERELEKRRQQIFRDFEARMRTSLTQLDAVKREKIAPIIERVIKAFLESAHGN